jgi:hypothetical protein
MDLLSFITFFAITLFIVAFLTHNVLGILNIYVYNLYDQHLYYFVLDCAPVILISDSLLFIPDFSKFGPRMGNDVGLDGYNETCSFVCHNLVCNHLLLCI